MTPIPDLLVVGAGITGLCAAWTAQQRGASVVVLEATHRTGGLVETEAAEGCLIEHGPDSILTMKPAGAALISALGLDSDVVTPAASRTFVWVDGALHPLPPSLLAPSASMVAGLIASPLFTLGGKARLAGEPFISRRAEGGDESVASFFSRRFGQEMVDRLIDPLFGGVYATPTTELSLLATLPRFAAMEEKYGSVSAGMATAALSARGPSGPMMISLRGGIERLTDRLTDLLGDRIRRETPVQALLPHGDGIVAHSARGPIRAGRVIVALPPWTGAGLVAEWDADLSGRLATAGARPLDAWTLLWDRGDILHPLDGTGFVVAQGEGRTLAACTWMSQKWAGRAPEGTVLMRCFVHPRGRESGPLREAMLAELREVLGTRGVPIMERERRVARALPRREVGCIARFDGLRQRAASLERIALAGAALGAVGVPDCVESAQAAVAALGWVT